MLSLNQHFIDRWTNHNMLIFNIFVATEIRAAFSSWKLINELYQLFNAYAGIFFVSILRCIYNKVIVISIKVRWREIFVSPFSSRNIYVFLHCRIQRFSMTTHTTYIVENSLYPQRMLNVYFNLSFFVCKSEEYFFFR